MMELSSVQAVVQRIADIEYKVGIKRPGGGVPGFHQMLRNEMKSQQAKGHGAVQSEARTTEANAQKPSVQPQPTQKTGSLPEASPKTPSLAPPPANAKAPDAGAPLPEMSSLADNAYVDTIRNVAEKYGLDPKLVSAVAEVESGFSQDVVSSVGAVGVMQLMPETAESLGVDPHDAAQNIEGGAHYLRKMLDSFDGDIRKAVAAYNAGPEAVREYGGIPPYSETQHYVTSVLDLYR